MSEYEYSDEARTKYSVGTTRPKYKVLGNYISGNIIKKGSSRQKLICT